jgi:Dolichyl-phosphate-mannose-protein mannosyltransferase
MVRAVLFKGAGCLTTRATSYLRKSKVFLCESKSLPVSVPRVGSAVLICVYAIVLVSLSGARPLWLDEIWQLIGTRDLSGPPLMRYVATFPGAAPLGYLVQHWTINLFGFSLFSARFPSELCSVFCCTGLILICRQLCIQNPWFPLLCWMLLPIQLRYAVEGRPYEQGLLFSVLGTYLFFRLLEQSSFVNGVAYAVVVALGVYSAPYTLFLQGGYVFWVVVFQRDRVKGFLVVTALALSGCAFLPWYLTASNYWKDSIASSADVSFKVTPKFVLLPIREISGGGYVCSISLLVLAAWGCFSPRLSRPAKAALLLGTGSSFLCVLVTDLVFGYFFAVRQIMFILVPLVLLAAAGLSMLIEQKRWVLGGVLVSTLFVGSIVKDVRYFSDHTEDWAAGARLLRSVTNEGACLRFAAKNDAQIYAFFESSIVRSVCTIALNQSLVAVPIHRYNQQGDVRKVQERLKEHGFSLRNSVQAGGTDLKVYRFLR